MPARKKKMQEPEDKGGIKIHPFAGPPKEPDPYARRLQLPKMPFNVDRGVGKMAMDDAGGATFPYQGYLGGSVGGSAFALYFPGYPYLAMLAQRTEYRQPVETHAKDMTREWIEFTSSGKKDKVKKIAQLEKRFKELDVQSVIAKALIHDGFYGVGHIFINLKGHDDTAKPVLLDKKSIAKGSLLGFLNIEPMWVTPIMWNAYDPTSPSFYKPETWVALNKTCHKTRLLQLITREVPDILKPAYNFGGLSMSQLIQPYVERWLRTVNSVNWIINNFSLIALKTDMSGVLEGGSDAQLQRRMKLARQQGDNSSMFLLDKEAEELDQVSVSLGGLSELQAQAQEHMAMPTHQPLVVLTGITPAGLNASSDGEIEVYHDWNRSEQNGAPRNVITHMMHVTMLDLWGEIDEDIDFKFVPIKQVDGEALARIKKTQSESDIAYVDAGVVDKQEVREKLAHDPDSGFDGIDVNKMPEPLDDGENEEEREPTEDDDGDDDGEG